jgi:hypothetical protein
MLLVMHTEMLGQKHGVWHRPTPKTQGGNASELAHLGFCYTCHQHLASWQELRCDCVEAAHVIKDCS